MLLFLYKLEANPSQDSKILHRIEEFFHRLKKILRKVPVILHRIFKRLVKKILMQNIKDWETIHFKSFKGFLVCQLK